MNKISKAMLERLRADTRGCSNVIHFNNAGASLPPDVVVDTVVDYLRTEALVGGYEAEAGAAERLTGVYGLVAELIGAEKEEIALFENASAAWQTAFRGIGLAAGDEVITTELEYVTGLIGLSDVRKTGVKVRVVAHEKDGRFPLDRLEAAITSNTKLIAVTHVASSGGGVLPVEEIGVIARRHQVFYLLDACQSVGQYPVDVRAIGCDLLSATGHKYLRAPRGTGFLYVRRSVQDRLRPVLTDFLAAGNVGLDGYQLRGDARRFELYEKSRALTLGLGKAVEYALGVGMAAIWERVVYLADLMRGYLREIPGVVVHDRGDRLCGIVTFSVVGMESMVVKERLGAAGINVSFGGAQATPLYMERYGLTGIVRASVHYYNTEEEVEGLCAVVWGMVGHSTGRS